MSRFGPAQPGLQISAGVHLLAVVAYRQRMGAKFARALLVDRDCFVLISRLFARLLERLCGPSLIYLFSSDAVRALVFYLCSIAW